MRGSRDAPALSLCASKAVVDSTSRAPVHGGLVARRCAATTQRSLPAATHPWSAPGRTLIARPSNEGGAFGYW